MESTVALMNNLPFKGTERERLLAAIRPAQVLTVDPEDAVAVRAALDRADIALLAGDLDERFLEAPKLRWVHCDHAGLTHSARPEVFNRGLIVTGSAGRSGPALAEHVMMFALMLSARYWIFSDAQKRGEWLRTPEMASLRPLSGRTMGIVGMGHTGTELVRRAKAFNMKVVAEGIDNPHTLASVRHAGCDVGQGYLFAPALQAERLDRWMTQHDAQHAAQAPLFEPKPLTANRFSR